jgi:15-cis-phytoene synthase
VFGFDGVLLRLPYRLEQMRVAIQLKNRQRSTLQPASDWETCRLVARTHGKSFYVASLCLPSERRRAIHAVYAFCRMADDIVDRATCLDAARRDIDAWERELDDPVGPVARAFAFARMQYGVPEDAARELLAGVRMDLLPRRYATWDELRGYCHAVAGTVGLMVAPILGCRDASALVYAAELGIAMQLTNILRDICEDAAQGRLYLPVHELADFGVDPDSVLAGQPNGAFCDFMAFQIDRARLLYAVAEQGIPALDSSGRLATLAAKQFYSEILTEIEKLDYDVFRARAHLTTSQKLRALPGVFVGFTQLSLSSARSHA